MIKKEEIEIDNEEGSAWITISTKLYTPETIITVSKFFLESCYVLVDGDPETEIVVELIPKNKEQLDKISKEFVKILNKYQKAL